MNNKTVYNLLSKIEVIKLFEKAKKEGKKKVFLADDSLQHLFDVSEAIKKTGVEAAVGGAFPFRIGTTVVELVLYPRNNKGKELLVQLSTKFHQNEKQSLTLEGLKKTFEEMVVVIDSKGVTDIRPIITIIKEVCRKEFIFVGLRENFSQEHKVKNVQILDILKKEKIGYVAFSETNYLEEDEFEAYNMLRVLNGLEELEDYDHILLNQSDFEVLFDYVDMEESSQKIATLIKADWKIEEEEIFLPSFDVQEKFEITPIFKERFKQFINSATKEQVRSAAYLYHLVSVGVKKKYNNDPKAITRALNELDVIIGKKFADYFLIVWDFIDAAKKNGIPVGPGRGSAAGSLVAFVLGITDVCPLIWKLQFERFLNIFRKDFPDIDVDVSQKYREWVINYLRKKYGEDKFSHIITRTNYGFKGVLNEILKKVRVPEDKVKAMMDLKPENYSTLGELLSSKGKEVKELMASSKDVEMLLNLCYGLKDVPKGTSRHGAGVLISSVPLKEKMPMTVDEDGNLMTQVPNDNDTNSLEKMGFLKFDVLGLRNLDIIENARAAIEKKVGKKFTLDMIPFDDKKTLELFREGRLKGVFQMESYNASKFAKEIGIESFADIVALNALNRPGPMENIPVYAKQKGKPIQMFSVKGDLLEGVECLYSILEETNGVIVYQEQINEIVREWAGYSLAEAELFRKAVSKKQSAILNQQKAEFKNRALKKGRDEKTTKAIFELILKFANYGFNKSHAVVYSKLSYITAFMKAHFPAEYLAAVMSSVGNDTSAVSEYIAEAREMDIEVLRPDVNESTVEFISTNNGIRCGLVMVKDVGLKTVESLLKIKGDKTFSNFGEFLSRVRRTQHSGVSESNIVALVKAGALDSIGKRSEMLKALKGEVPSTLGEAILEELKYAGTIFSVANVPQMSALEKCKDKENCISGVITSLYETLDRNKKQYAKCTIATFDGRQKRMFIFNKVWKNVKDEISKGDIVVGQFNDNILNKIKKIEL